MKKLLLVLCVLLMAMPCFGKDFKVQLTWDANSETDLAGYRVYRSETPGSYSVLVDELGLVTEYTETLTVNDGEVRTFYYIVTAFDQTNLESDYSNEVNTQALDGNVSPAPVNNLIINIQIVIAMNHDGTYSIAMTEK